ncbi:MAG: hypothetical protein CMJ49_11275 [Planctomycetaceae bacterium]|nr:hypothetical protein [Planctomycetaceae bacterium]
MLNRMPATESQPQAILIIRPSALGDVARSVPVAASLRHAYPDAQIDWLVRDDFADVVRAHPAVDHIIEFPRKQLRRWWRSPATAVKLMRYLRELARRGYDTVYDLQGLFRSGALSHRTGATRRVGFANAREGAAMFYNYRYRIDPSHHTVDRMLGLIEADGVEMVRNMRLYVPTADQRWADRMLREHDIQDRQFAVVAPTSRWESKRWPIERFTEVSDRLPELGIEAAVVVGSPGEEAQAAGLLALRGAGRLRVADLVGRTSVGQLMALIERSAVVLCNDSAALHIAVGLGKRAVAVYGPTDPSLVGPYRYERGWVGPPSTVSANYNFKRLDQAIISTVCVDAVWCRMQQVMNAPGPALVHDQAPQGKRPAT